MRLKKDLDIFSIDKHQELDLPSQVHVEEDEDEVDEDEGIYLSCQIDFFLFFKEIFFFRQMDLCLFLITFQNFVY